MIPNAIPLLGGLSYLIGAERWIPMVTRRVICRADTLDKRIALTFDDGPRDKHTSALLGKLASHHVRATFFLIGRNLERHPELGRAIVEAGHEVANHTFTHRRLPFLSNEDIRNEIVSTAELIQHTLGVKTSLYRPPYGLFTRRVLDVVEPLEHRCVIGDVFPLDLACPKPEVIAQRVLRRISPGAIVILHDLCIFKGIGSSTAAALDILIPRLKCKGYEFVTLSELLRA